MVLQNEPFEYFKEKIQCVNEPFLAHEQIAFP